VIKKDLTLDSKNTLENAYKQGIMTLESLFLYMMFQPTAETREHYGANSTGVYIWHHFIKSKDATDQALISKLLKNGDGGRAQIKFKIAALFTRDAAAMAECLLTMVDKIMACRVANAAPDEEMLKQIRKECYTTPAGIIHACLRKVRRQEIVTESEEKVSGKKITVVLKKVKKIVNGVESCAVPFNSEFVTYDERSKLEAVSHVLEDLPAKLKEMVEKTTSKDTLWAAKAAEIMVGHAYEVIKELNMILKNRKRMLRALVVKDKDTGKVSQAEWLKKTKDMLATERGIPDSVYASIERYDTDIIVKLKSLA